MGVLALAGAMASPVTASASDVESHRANTPVAASNLPPAVPDPTEQVAIGTQEALKQDAATSSTTVDQLEWQVEFGEFLTELKLRYPDEYSYAVADVDHATAEVWFKGSVPADALTNSEKLPGITVQGDTGFSETELNEDVALVLREVQEVNSTMGNGYASGDPANRTIQVGFDSANTANRSAADLGDTAKSVEDAVLTLSDRPTDFAVSVKASSEPVVEPEDFDGGWLLQVGGNPHCTMSFPIAKNGSSAAGLLTAGHCEGTGTYGGVANAFNSPMNGSLQTTDAYPGGDMRWNWSTVTLSGATFMGQGNRRFSSSSFPYVGGTACKYGWATQYGCSTVTGLNTYYYVTPGGHPSLSLRVGPLASVSSHITSGGDSGGPWFVSSTGLGVHSGYVGGQSVFSQLPYVLQRLDVRLLY